MIQRSLRMKNNVPTAGEHVASGMSGDAAATGSSRRFILNKSGLHILLFAGILLVGIFARTWEFRSLPPGLDQDEASDGVDAYSLYHYGMDANGNSFPVYLVAFGSGTSALYAYILVPFIALGGLSPFTVRLPMLLSGILTLPLVYGIGRRVINKDFGLISMFLLAISPWHILLSRWALDGNILPFTFSIAFLCLLEALNKPLWFVPAMLFMGISMYAYSTAYAAIPVFLAIALPIMIWAKRLSMRSLALGFTVLVVVCAPLGLFLLVNTWQFESIHLGSITIPRLPMKPRYETQGVFFGQNAILNTVGNLRELARLLWTQEDGYNWNAFSPYGYFYAYTLPFAALGAALLAGLRRRTNTIEQMLLLAWLVAGLALGFLQPPNINRINLVFIPLIFCVAAVVLWIAEHSKAGLVISVVAFLIAFAFFTHDYHGEQYRSAAAADFFQGFLPAVDFAARQGPGPVCITGRVNMPYIYVLFSQHPDPHDYLGNIRYGNLKAQFRQVDRLDQYTFGLDKCRNLDNTIYVLADESFPQARTRYRSIAFDRFTVYVPDPHSP